MYVYIHIYTYIFKKLNCFQIIILVFSNANLCFSNVLSQGSQISCINILFLGISAEKFLDTCRIPSYIIYANYS